MEENATLLEEAIRELQEVRRQMRNKTICEPIDRSHARINEVHHNLTTRVCERSRDAGFAPAPRLEEAM